MQERVLAQRPELIRTFSQVNPEYSGLLEHEYLDQVCNRSISTPEIIHVARTLPTKITLTQHNLRQENGLITKIGFVMSINQKILQRNNGTYIEIIIDTIHGIGIREITFTQFQQYYQGAMSEKDLLTFYSIWVNRLSCIQINPDYAKNRTLNKLNQYWDMYNNFLNTHDKIDFQYKAQIIWTYMYMYMGKYVFNIMDNSNLTKLSNIDQNLDDIKNDIRYLYQAIRQRILLL
jgi:hypothetical protein